ncbi:MAG: polysaccharide biosynthesis protein [Sandaracinaceae bacterium]
MSKRVLRLQQMIVDLMILLFAFVLAFLLRFDWQPPREMVGRLLLALPYVVAIEYGVLASFGVRNFSWRYVGMWEAWRILQATAVSFGALVAIRLVVGALAVHLPGLATWVIPLGILAINVVLMFLGVTGIRVARRLLGEHLEARARGAHVTVVPTMLVGAGEGGRMMSREIAQRPDLGLRAVGFLDDDPRKVGMVLNAVPVVGPTDRLAELCKRYGAKQVLITMASAPGQVLRRITRLAEEADLPVKTIPGLFELASGRVALTGIRSVAIEDLLRRAPVQLDAEAIAEDLQGRAVLVTGAGGSIGSELCRQVAAFRPRKLLLVERAENNLFQIHRQLHKLTDRDVEVIPLLADVTDSDRMRDIIAQHRPRTVFHAAAHKHVPMMEWNPGEAVKNNVFGTHTVATLADEHGVRSFVMVSTDKAVNPTNVMGATKRVAEMVVQSLATRSDTRYVTVRFGNVLGSAGSVIPIFREQIANGGPVTVTHPDMERYFMTIPEACQLVLQAESMGHGGEIFILDMGEPVKIVDLARDLIRLSGFRPDEDIEITFVGVRPGEKLYEELSTDEEQAAKTRHPKIYVGSRPPPTPEEVQGYLRVLRSALALEDPEAAVATLRECVPEFQKPEPGRRRRRSTFPPPDARPAAARSA